MNTIKSKHKKLMKRIRLIRSIVEIIFRRFTTFRVPENVNDDGAHNQQRG